MPKHASKTLTRSSQARPDDEGNSSRGHHDKPPQSIVQPTHTCMDMHASLTGGGGVGEEDMRGLYSTLVIIHCE